MTYYIARRLFQTIFVILGVTTISFGSMFLSGDPTILLLDEASGMTEAEINAIRHEIGFDRPVIIQYFEWLGNATRGDFGISLHHRQSNFKLVVERMPATLELTFASLAISLIVSFPLGIVAALRSNTLVDRLIVFGGTVCQSTPRFLLGIMLMFVFGVSLGWVPVSGRGTWQRLIMPVIAISLFSVARNARIIRSSMLEVMNSEYILTSRAKGLTEYLVVVRHALRNALIPVITLIGLDFGNLIGGTVVIETVFAWPGVGRLTLQAINTKDFPLVQASVTILALTFVLINLLVDLIYTWLDPCVHLH